MNTDAIERELPIFVYGTLLPEQPNAFLWGSGIAEIETAVLQPATLYDMGHYPMLVEEAGQVTGALVRVRPEQYTAVVARLDELEGFDPAQPEASAYRRLARGVRLADGREAMAWVYVGGTSFVQGCPRIDDGDWAAYIRARAPEMDSWWANVQTVRGRHEQGDSPGE